VQHLVLRGGAGFYYGPTTHNVASATNNSDGFSSSTTWNATCSNADSNTVFNTGSGACVAGQADNFTGPYSLSNPFPSGVVPVFTTAPAGLANNLGTTLNTVLRSQRTPTIYNYNFALEYELPHQVVVTVGYVGSRGLFLPFSSVDLNQLQDVVQKYVSQYNLLVAAGPVTAASVVKMFTKNKMANLAVVGGGVWFAIQELSTPMLKLMNDQFGYLQSIFSMFRG